MVTEDVFLAKLLEEPNDDSIRLIYADWLEERGDPVSTAKAEFLRLSVQMTSAEVRKGRKKELRKLLQQRAAELDTDWLAVVSHLLIENCLAKRRRRGETRRHPAFSFLCDRRWEDMKPTDDRTVRFCEACQQNVHYCDTIMEARRHDWDGHCIAVDLGVIRRERDLEPEMIVAGRPSVSFLRREEERMKPDAVSAERERRKREKALGGESLASGNA